MNQELSANTTLSHYRILSKLGDGGMGEVYRAYDVRLDREVAIKLTCHRPKFKAATARVCREFFAGKQEVADLLRRGLLCRQHTNAPLLNVLIYGQSLKKSGRILGSAFREAHRS